MGTAINRNENTQTATKRKGGRGTCAVCDHPRRDEFDQALIARTMTQAAVAREVGCDPSSVSRHRKHHLLPAASALVADDPELVGIDILSELRGLYRAMKSTLETARDSKNWTVIRGAHSLALKNLELLAKLLLVLDTRDEADLAQSAEWVTMRTALMEALAPFPEAQTAVSQAMRAVRYDAE